MKHLKAAPGTIGSGDDEAGRVQSDGRDTVRQPGRTGHDLRRAAGRQALDINARRLGEPFADRHQQWIRGTSVGLAAHHANQIIVAGGQRDPPPADRCRFRNGERDERLQILAHLHIGDVHLGPGRDRIRESECRRGQPRGRSRHLVGAGESIGGKEGRSGQARTIRKRRIVEGGKGAAGPGIGRGERHREPGNRVTRRIAHQRDQRSAKTEAGSRILRGSAGHRHRCRYAGSVRQGKIGWVVDPGYRRRDVVGAANGAIRREDGRRRYTRGVRNGGVDAAHERTAGARYRCRERNRDAGNRIVTSIPNGCTEPQHEVGADRGGLWRTRRRRYRAHRTTGVGEVKYGLARGTRSRRRHHVTANGAVRAELRRSRHSRGTGGRRVHAPGKSAPGPRRWHGERHQGAIHRVVARIGHSYHQVRAERRISRRILRRTAGRQHVGRGACRIREAEANCRGDSGDGTRRRVAAQRRVSRQNRRRRDTRPIRDRRGDTARKSGGSAARRHGKLHRDTGNRDIVGIFDDHRKRIAKSRRHRSGLRISAVQRHRRGQLRNHRQRYGARGRKRRSAGVRNLERQRRVGYRRSGNS